MKATRCLLALATVALLSSGCAVAWQVPVDPPRGILFSQYRAPLTANFGEVPVSEKVGTASTFYVNFFGYDFAWDDARIEAAAREGGLSRVDYADYEVMQILGIFAQFTVRAYGE